MKGGISLSPDLFIFDEYLKKLMIAHSLAVKTNYRLIYTCTVARYCAMKAEEMRSDYLVSVCAAFSMWYMYSPNN